MGQLNQQSIQLCHLLEEQSPEWVVNFGSRLLLPALMRIMLLSLHTIKTSPHQELFGEHTCRYRIWTTYDFQGKFIHACILFVYISKIHAYMKTKIWYEHIWTGMFTDVPFIAYEAREKIILCVCDMYVVVLQHKSLPTISVQQTWYYPGKFWYVLVCTCLYHYPLYVLVYTKYILLHTNTY